MPTRKRPVEIALPKAAAQEIELLTKYAPRLAAIVEATKSLKPATAAYFLLQPLSQEIGLDYPTLRSLFNALQNLNILKEDSGTADAAFDRIAGALSADVAKAWKAERSSILPALEQYSNDNPVAISIKAERITYLHESIYREGEIITDARPVFDGTGENVLEMLILHSFVATYSKGGRTEALHLAMDAEDVLKLRKACDRAIVKAKTLKAALSQPANFSVEIVRDDDVAS